MMDSSEYKILAVGAVISIAGLVYSTNTGFESLLDALIASAKPSLPSGGVAKQALFSIAQCITVLCLAAGDQKPKFCNAAGGHVWHFYLAIRNMKLVSYVNNFFEYESLNCFRRRNDNRVSQINGKFVLDRFRFAQGVGGGKFKRAIIMENAIFVGIPANLI